MAYLEGSTLVKRLKAASRVQYRIGGRLGDQVSENALRLTGRLLYQRGSKRISAKELAELESKSGHDISNIMDDMQSYFERRASPNSRTFSTT